MSIGSRQLAVSLLLALPFFASAANAFHIPIQVKNGSSRCVYVTIYHKSGLINDWKVAGQPNWVHVGLTGTWSIDYGTPNFHAKYYEVRVRAEFMQNEKCHHPVAADKLGQNSHLDVKHFSGGSLFSTLTGPPWNVGAPELHH